MSARHIFPAVGRNGAVRCGGGGRSFVDVDAGNPATKPAAPMSPADSVGAEGWVRALSTPGTGAGGGGWKNGQTSRWRVAESGKSSVHHWHTARVTLRSTGMGSDL